MAGAAEQPTYAPTPRRLAEARRRGDVAHSGELRAVLALAAAGAVLVATGPSIAGQLRAYVVEALQGAARGGDFGAWSARALDSAVRILAAPLAVAFAAPVLVGLVQTGGLWVGAPRVDLGRLAPGRRARGAVLAGLARGAIAVAILLAVAAATLASPMPRLVSLAGAPPARALAAFAAVAERLGLRMLIAALLAGIADELWIRWRHRLRLRMTRAEIDRERKELEGDPTHRRAWSRERRRLAGASLAVAGIAGGVRQADLVVTGAGDDGDDGAGGAIAVALRYDPDGDRAPIVVASGGRAAAAPLIEEARAAGVPVVGDAGLALALGALPPGSEIPASAYEPVARLLRRVGGGPRGPAA